MAEYVFDQYDCGLCTPKCTLDLIGEVCQTSNLLTEYQKDRGDCLVSRIGDGSCDIQCKN